MNKELRKQIDNYIDEMIDMEYDLTNIFLVFNGRIYKKEKFTYRGLSVIYDDNIHTDFEFREFKAKPKREERRIRDSRFSNYRREVV